MAVFSRIFALPEEAAAADATMITSPQWVPPDPDGGPWEYLGSYYPYGVERAEDVACDVWRSLDSEAGMAIYRVVSSDDFVQHGATVDETQGLGQVVFEDEAETLAVVRIEHAIEFSGFGHRAGRWAFSQQEEGVGLVVSACASEQHQLLVAEAFQRTMAWLAAEQMAVPEMSAGLLARCADKMWEVLREWQASLGQARTQSTRTESQSPPTESSSE